ncbi:MAG: ketosteroid isomerase-like protein [Paraglaciecola sp.]|jgi:ketosteroid isomerase-like protein
MESTCYESSAKEQSLVIVNKFYKALSELYSDELLNLLAEDIAVNISGSTPVSGCVSRAELTRIVFPRLFYNLNLNSVLDLNLCE